MSAQYVMKELIFLLCSQGSCTCMFLESILLLVNIHVFVIIK